MAALVLTDAHVNLLAAAGGHLTLRDQLGRIVGIATPPPFTHEEIEEARRRLASNEKRYSAKEKQRTIAEILAQWESISDLH